MPHGVLPSFVPTPHTDTIYERASFYRLRLSDMSCASELDGTPAYYRRGCSDMLGANVEDVDEATGRRVPRTCRVRECEEK